MMDPGLEIELAGLSVPDMLRKLYVEVRAANSLCAAHQARVDSDLYGDPLHQIPGLKAMVQDHEAYIGRARFVSKLLITVLSVTGLANLGALIALVKVISGG
jgi:hypothetical protein